jgi:hypothetical protein
VLLAGVKVSQKFSAIEKNKLYFKQVTVNSEKSHVEINLTDDEKRRKIARKALNNWLSRLKNLYRPHEYKKNVKVKTEEKFAEETDEHESSSDEGEIDDEIEEGGDSEEAGGDSEEAGGDSEEAGDDSEEEGSAPKEKRSDREEDPTDEDGSPAQSQNEDQEDSADSD